jgi:excinuclease ABC subunit B
VQESLHVGDEDEDSILLVGEDDDVEAVIDELTKEMDEAAAKLEFARAALLRDQIDALRSGEFGKNAKPRGRSRSYGRRR